MKLYHYVHCPFCVRVRMAMGLLKISYESVIVPYNEEDFLVKISTKKMLPVVEWSDGSFQNESLDIIKKLDSKNLLQFDHYNSRQSVIDQLLDQIGNSVHSLCMPYWIWTPEFNDSSRAYFHRKKGVKRGNFNKLIQNKDGYLQKLAPVLANLEKELTPFYQSATLTISDVMIAAHLWGMFIFPEFQFSPKIYEYLMKIKEQAQFDYHHDFWQD